MVLGGLMGPYISSRPAAREGSCTSPKPRCRRSRRPRRTARPGAGCRKRPKPQTPKRRLEHFLVILHMERFQTTYMYYIYMYMYISVYIHVYIYMYIHKKCMHIHIHIASIHTHPLTFKRLHSHRNSLRPFYPRLYPKLYQHTMSLAQPPRRCCKPADVYTDALLLDRHAPRVSLDLNAPPPPSHGQQILYTCVCAYIYIHLCVYIYMYTYMHVHTYVYRSMNLHIHMQLSLCHPPSSSSPSALVTVSRPRGPQDAQPVLAPPPSPKSPSLASPRSGVSRGSRGSEG